MLICPRCREASPKDDAVCVLTHPATGAAIDPSVSNRCMTLVDLRGAAYAWAEERIVHNGDENMLALPFRDPPPRSDALFGVLQ